MLGPFATASRRTPHNHSPGVATVASHAACASMSTTTTTTTKTRDRRDRYGPMEWGPNYACLLRRHFICSYCMQHTYCRVLHALIAHETTSLVTLLIYVSYDIRHLSVKSKLY